MSDSIEKFKAEITESLASDSFVKLILSNYKGPEAHLQKIAVRRIETKRGAQVSFQKHYETRQVVKNELIDDGVNAIAELLLSGFRNAHLFTTTKDIQLKIGKKNSRLIYGKPTFAEKPSTSHDRPRRPDLIDQGAYYLKALGVTSDDGRVMPKQNNKWRQINKYVEILKDFYEKSDLTERETLKIVDMGSGKGYLTFAAYDYFTNVLGISVEMTGVENRPELVQLCNEIATASGFDGLKFVRSSIEDFEIDTVDILIALHACDTATDDALFKGIAGTASMILAAPCCQKEIRQQITAPPLLEEILKHGVMMERTAEMLTDGLRAMLLEGKGYSAKVFEFIGAEHTPKNNMIVALRRSGATATRSSADALMEQFGIRTQRLHTLLQRGAAGRSAAPAN